MADTPFTSETETKGTWTGTERNVSFPRTSFMVPGGAMQASKGGMQPTRLPNYEAYNP